MKYRAFALITIILFSIVAVGGSFNSTNWKLEKWNSERLAQNMDGVIEALTTNPNENGSDEPVKKCSDNGRVSEKSPYWDNHDLNELPVLENSGYENLPTADEVENILLHWQTFQEGRGPLWLDWTGPRQELLTILKEYGFEYHDAGDNGLQIDTPGIRLTKPCESRHENSQMIPTDDCNHFRIRTLYINIRNSLDFCRYLENLNIESGIGGIYIENLDNSAYPQAKVVVPVTGGLLFLHPTGGDYGAGWTGKWTAINPQPNEPYPWWGEGRIDKIRIYWRIGKGDYELRTVT